MPYYDRCVGADVAKVSVMVPAERIPELRPILLDWRRDAKLLLESDLLSGDPILQIRRCLPAPSDQVADHRCRNTGDRQGVAAGAATASRRAPRLRAQTALTAMTAAPHT